MRKLTSSGCVCDITAGTYRRINNIDFKIPRHFSPEAADLVRAVSIESRMRVTPGCGHTESSLRLDRDGG